MAERIVSPGVFTRERDLSFLPQAIGEIGAAIIGPTKKGPAFTPTQVTSFQEFEEMCWGFMELKELHKTPDLFVYEARRRLMLLVYGSHGRNLCLFIFSPEIGVFFFVRNVCDSSLIFEAI